MMGVIKMFNMTEHYEFDDFVVGTAVACVGHNGKKIVGVVVNKTNGDNYYYDTFDVFWEGHTIPSSIVKEYFNKDYYALTLLRDWKKFKKQLRCEV